MAGNLFVLLAAVVCATYLDTLRNLPFAVDIPLSIAL